MSQHTPGPWTVEGDKICDVVAEKQSYLIAQHVLWVDAHLIAAAPDMYETLKEAWSFLAFRDNNRELFDKITAALAKAEGRE